MFAMMLNSDANPEFHMIANVEMANRLRILVQTTHLIEKFQQRVQFGVNEDIFPTYDSQVISRTDTDYIIGFNICDKEKKKNFLQNMESSFKFDILGVHQNLHHDNESSPNGWNCQNLFIFQTFKIITRKCVSPMQLLKIECVFWPGFSSFAWQKLCPVVT